MLSTRRDEKHTNSYASSISKSNTKLAPVQTNAPEGCNATPCITLICFMKTSSIWGLLKFSQSFFLSIFFSASSATGSCLRDPSKWPDHKGALLCDTKHWERPPGLSRQARFSFKQETLAAGRSRFKHLISWQGQPIFCQGKKNYFLLQPRVMAKRDFLVRWGISSLEPRCFRG